MTSPRAVDFEALIAEISSRFIHAPASGLDREIEASLAAICTWFDFDFVVIWQWSTASPEQIFATHFHHSTLGRQPPAPLDQRHYPWYRQQMLNGRMVAISSLEDLPPEAAIDREDGRRFGIKSNLCLPLLLGGEQPVGALGLNMVRTTRDWPAAVIGQLQLVAQLITSALARQRTTEALHASEGRLALALEAGGVGLWTFDADAGELWMTPQARALFGYSPDETVTLQRFEASVLPDDLDAVRTAIDRSTRHGMLLDIEYRIMVPGEAGENEEPRVRRISSRGRTVPTGPAQGFRLTGYSVDVTERHRLVDELRANEARLTVGAELAQLGFYETDFRTGILHGDDRFCDLLGMHHHAGTSVDMTQHWAKCVHPEDLAKVLALRDQLHSGKLARIATQYRYSHPVRGEIWVDHLSAAVAHGVDGRLLRNIGVVRDISAQKRKEVELREMGQRLLRAQEHERALIGRELHDDVSQRLAVIAIEIARAEGATTGAAQTAMLRSARLELVRISEDVHSLAYQLHPSVLEELGLAAALRAECERRARQSGREVTVSIDELPDALGSETALCLFRVAQEALNNAIRHANAPTTRVRLRRQADGLLLSVHDDGCGFDKQLLRSEGRLGLVSMRERMGIVRGTLEIDTAPGSGTAVIAWAPCGGGQ